MPARLYVVPASHPCAAVMGALDRKRVDYRVINLVPVFHKAHQKLRFGGKGTVPGIVFEDGRKLLGSREIIAELDRRYPEPRLVSDDPRVQEAEAWGEEVLQPLVRRLAWQALSRDAKAQASYTEGVRLTPPVPAFMAAMSAGLVGWAERRLNAATDEAARADLVNLPGHLDRIDSWLAAGVLGGEQVTSADLQIAASLRLLMTLGDVEPLVAARPCGDYARRLFPQESGHVRAGALPPEWLPSA